MRPAARLVKTLYGLLWFEPVERGGEAEDTGEAGSGLLVARGNSAPLLQPRPEALDSITVGVNPLWTGDGRLMPLRRDRRPRAHVPDMLAEAMAGVAAVPHHPLRHARQLIQQRDGLGQLMRLSGRDPEGDGATSAVDAG